MDSLKRKTFIDQLIRDMARSPDYHDMMVIKVSDVKQLIKWAQVGQRFRHKKRQTTYEVIGIAKLHYGAAMPNLGDLAPLVIYKADVDGTLWARPQSEFDDGRFEGVNS